MSKEIRTLVWCDGPSHQEDEQVEAAVTRRFAVDTLKEREIDLCEVCDKELVQPLLELLKENGQPIKGGQQTPTLFDEARPKRTATRQPAAILCPIEDCDWKGSKSAGEQHAPRYHNGESLAVLEGRYGRRLLDGSRMTLPFACAECEAKYESNRSLAGHVSKGHGA